MLSMIRLALLASTAMLVIALAPAPADLRGFSPSASRIERDWEAKLDAIPSPDSMREHMRLLSARPHHVGSPYDKQNAEWILAQFKAYGFDAHIEQFDVLFPTPKERVVEMVAPTRFVAALAEPALPDDPTSGQQKEQLPSYNAYSVDGDVTGPLVYVNYGAPADYDALDRHGRDRLRFICAQGLPRRAGCRVLRGRRFDPGAGRS